MFSVFQKFCQQKRKLKSIVQQPKEKNLLDPNFSQHKNRVAVNEQNTAIEANQRYSV